MFTLHGPFIASRFGKVTEFLAGELPDWEGAIDAKKAFLELGLRAVHFATETHVIGSFKRPMIWFF